MNNNLAVELGAPRSDARSPKILTKSLDLFSRRGIISLATRFLPSEEAHCWLNIALTIQRRIYDLDYYYEQTADLKGVEEQPLWNALAMELDLANEFVDSSFDDLKRYGVVESKIHSFDRIEAEDFAAIADLKCADVRMARGLIYSFANKIPPPSVLEFWRVFDQCWELIEDIQDIGEDGTDWNFNFWLYQYMSGGDLLNGLEVTHAVLNTKVSELHRVHRSLPYRFFVSTIAALQKTIGTAAILDRRKRQFYGSVRKRRILTFKEQLA